MAEIKLINKDTDIQSLKMSKIDWDVVINEREYQMVRIEGYVHSIGGRFTENNVWLYPRDEEPSYENLIEYSGFNEGGICWGIKYEPRYYTKTKYDETECRRTSGAMITRNGKDFYLSNSMDEAIYIINRKLGDHPLNLHEYKFDKKMIGRKVWWRSEPGVITSWIGNGQACVIIEPDGIDKFTTPAEFAEEDGDMYYEDGFVKADIFDNHIWWFRDED